MPEEVNSKALAAGSTANRLEFHRKPVGRPRAPATPLSSTSSDCGVHLSRYRATICRMVFHEGRQAIRTNDRKMSSHLLAQHLRLAQNDKRKSEHDGRSDHGSELGKYRAESARSELQRLAPCSPTKIVHVGLHAATSCRAPHPAPAHQSGGSMQGNNSPVNKRTVRRRRKVGRRHAVAAARRSTRRRV